MFKLITPILTLTLSFQLLANDFQIHFDGQCKLGDHQRIHAKYVQSTKATVNPILTHLDLAQIPPLETKIESEMEADIETLAIINGRSSKTKITFIHSKCLKDNTPVTPIPDGTVLLASGNEGHQVFNYLDGSKIPTDTEDYIPELISIDTGPDNDELFCPHARKKIGESWPLSKQSANKIIQNVDSTPETATVSGLMKLDGIVKNNGDKCARISVNITINLFNQEPSGIIKDDSFFVIPIDYRKGPNSIIRQTNTETTGKTAIQKEGETIDCMVKLEIISREEVEITHNGK